MWKSSIFLNSDDSQYFYTIGALTPLDKYSQELRKTLPYSKYGTTVVSKMVTLIISQRKKKKKEHVQVSITRTSSFFTLLKSKKERYKKAERVNHPGKSIK